MILRNLILGWLVVDLIALGAYLGGPRMTFGAGTSFVLAVVLAGALVLLWVGRPR